MNRRDLFRSVGAGALLAIVPLSSREIAVAVSRAYRTITLPPPIPGAVVTIRNTGDKPLLIEAPTETVELPTGDTWRNHPHELVELVSDGNSWLEMGE